MDGIGVDLMGYWSSELNG